MMLRLLATAAIASVLIATPAIAACPPGSLQGLNVHQCYVLGNKSVTWSQAEEDCASLGGHLASVSSLLTNLYLYMELKASTRGDYWLDGYYAMYFDDKFPNTVWSWSETDGASGSATGQRGQPWSVSGPVGLSSSEPVLSDPACLAVDYNSGKWRSTSCDEAKVYLCSVPEVIAPTNVPGAPTTPFVCPPNMFC